MSDHVPLYLLNFLHVSPHALRHSIISDLFNVLLACLDFFVELQMKDENCNFPILAHNNFCDQYKFCVL